MATQSYEDVGASDDFDQAFQLDINCINKEHGWTLELGNVDFVWDGYKYIRKYKSKGILQEYGEIRREFLEVSE